MFNDRNVVVVVPARGGSKGIHKKNIVPLKGKPLIEYTLDIALKSSYVDEVIVSTDDLEIEAISKNNSVKVVKRPEALSTDNSLTIDAIKHVVEQTDLMNDRTILIVLQVTSPLRMLRHIEDSLKLFTSEYTSVIGVCEAEHTPYKMYKIFDNKLIDFISEDWRDAPRQTIPKVYRENGSIYVTDVHQILNHNSLRGNRPRPYIMGHSYSIDIDTKLDLKFAELMLEIEVMEI